MIYIVEDDAEIRELETYVLNSSGFEVKSFDCAKSMNEEVKAQRYSYQMGVHYMDLINDCEKLGDYVVNVVEAHVNHKLTS